MIVHMDKAKLILPVSILAAAVLISGSFIYTASKKDSAGGNADAGALEANMLKNVKPVTQSDHVRGATNPKIVVVEYSDTECPFCKVFHAAMQRIVSEYPNDVAWVYRHFPLAQLHPKAFKESVATECAAALGGNEMFWKYTDRLLEVTPSNNGLDPAELPNIAEYVGLDREEFTTCLAKGDHDEKIQAHIDEAIDVGARGTPFSVIIAGNDRIPVPGALPYESMKEAVETLLEK